LINVNLIASTSTYHAPRWMKRGPWRLGQHLGRYWSGEELWL